ncbi:MAG: BatD family protein [Bacteroidales bacterium]
MLKNLVFTVFMILAAVSRCHAAEDIQFRASARSQVTVGERFQVVYTLNAQGKDFQGPSFENFRVLTGPNVSSSQSYQIINGKMSQSLNITYSYIIQATTEGTFEIDPATIHADGKQHQSNKLKIKVLKSSSPSPQSSGGQRPAGEQEDSRSHEGKKENVFIKAYADKRTPYLGEQVIITYKIYTNTQISQVSIDKLSSFRGFWSKNLMDPDRKMEQKRAFIDGEEYVTADIRKIALFPQKTGKLSIEPMELTCVAQIRKEGTRRTRDPFFDSFFDDPFFNNRYQNVELKLASDPLTIDVRPLPEEGKPAGFSGAVGSFSLRSGIDQTEVKTNEPITLKYVLSGSGNIELISHLDVSFPPDFETYEPKIINDIRANASGVSGTRTFEYLIIPRTPGNFTIRPVNFSFFDLASKTYKTLTTPGYSIKVEKGADLSGGMIYSGVSQADIQYIGSDIRHIKHLPFHVFHGHHMLFASRIYYILLAVPPVIFLLFLLIWRRQIRQKQDAARQRNKKATRIARKNLKKAKAYLKSGNEKEFFLEISRSLWGYLGDKFNIPPANLSTDNIRQKLLDRNVSESTVKAFMETLDHTEYARFAPGESTSRMNELYREAIQIITSIEKELKK